MRKKRIVLIILVVMFILSLVFPIKTNTLKRGYSSGTTAIQLKNEKYVFDIVPDENDLSGVEYRFCNFDTADDKGIIHYRFEDYNGNVIFEKVENVSDITTNAYMSEYFDKIKNSKGKTFKFIVWYDEYHKDNTFGIWVSDTGSDTNYLENDNSYGMEIYLKSDVSNIMMSWFILIGISIYLLYIMLEKDYGYEKEK